MHILVTGSSGLLGARISEDLIRRGHVVRLATREPSSMAQSNQQLIKIDWKNDVTLLDACKNIDVVIHAAGMNAHDSFKDPCGALESNGLASAKLARSARLSDVKRLIYFSTAHVYSSNLVGTITEDCCPTNLHPYASSHLAGEYAMRQAGLDGGMQVLVLRLSNAFGAPINPNTNCWHLLINDLCRQYAQNKRMKLTSSGQQWRDFIPISNVCEAVSKLISSNFDFNSVGVLNLGGQSMPVIDMARLIRSRANELYGSLPVIDRSSTNTELISSAHLNYCSDQLANLIGDMKLNINYEIDSLLKFSIQHFKKSRSNIK
jgi:UDP-glucose 4-epimerase